MAAIRLVTRVQDQDDGPGALAAADELKVPRWNNTTGKFEMTAVSVEMRVYTVQTTSATITVIGTVAIPTDNVVGFLVRVVGIKNDQTQAAFYLDALTVRNNAGTVTQVGTATRIHVNEDDAAWDVTFVINGTNLEIKVTGVAATTINWRAAVETVSQLAA